MLRKTVGVLRVMVIAFSVCIVCAQTAAVDQAAAAAPSSPELKFFEAATNLANTLTNWAFLMIGGSILAILGTSYYRPTSRWIRMAYFAFVPAWFFLSWSVYAGTRVQSVYLAALFVRTPKFEPLKEVVNHDALAQINRMELGLTCFGIWLTVYLLWWIFHEERKDVKP